MSSNNLSRKKGRNRDRQNRERKIGSFMRKTGLERSTAIKCLELSNWKVNDAIREATKVMKEIEKRPRIERRQTDTAISEKEALVKKLCAVLHINAPDSTRYLKRNNWIIDDAVSEYERDLHNAFLSDAIKPKEQMKKSASSRRRRKKKPSQDASKDDAIQKQPGGKTITKQKPQPDPDYQIDIRSFVVYQNKFRCRHNSHVIDDINASVRIITDKEEDLTFTVPAGYCRTCRTFFIMNDTYERLKKKGTIACRISSEKAYIKGTTTVGNMVLAQESVLKQFGYSVSQTDGLTRIRRCKILALVIDNKILTRAEVIGYLDFFISQHKSPSFAIAVSKWEEDKGFLHTYKIGSYLNYGIAGLSL